MPEEWLETIVYGGFKVWHIIFIIMALTVSLISFCCCLHRCRIPRTKQEIEADLMRSNMANKFRDYLQELPSEPTTLIEACKRVQELGERLELQDARDLGNRKRMGWLKLKVRERAEKEAAVATGSEAHEGDQAAAEKAADQTTDSTVKSPKVPAAAQEEPARGADLEGSSERDKKEEVKNKAGATLEAPNGKKEGAKEADGDPVKARVARRIKSGPGPGEAAGPAPRPAPGSNGRPVRSKRRRDKPNLARSKVHVKSIWGESIEHNQLEPPLPAPNRLHQHHREQVAVGGERPRPRPLRGPTAAATTTTTPTGGHVRIELGAASGQQ